MAKNNCARFSDGHTLRWPQFKVLHPRKNNTHSREESLRERRANNNSYESRVLRCPLSGLRYIKKNNIPSSQQPTPSALDPLPPHTLDLDPWIYLGDCLICRPWLLYYIILYYEYVSPTTISQYHRHLC